MTTDIKATFIKFKPALSAEEVVPITDQALLDEILLSPELKDFKRSLNGDIFLEVPSDLNDLRISIKLKSMLDQYKGKILCIST